VLAKGFGRVLLYVPWKNAFPKSNLFSVGEGLPNVEKVTDWEDYFDETDCYFFPDVYDGGLQLLLRSLGKPVWGSAKGEELELFRWETKHLLKELGLPVQPVERIIGLDALREHLMEVDDKFVKISRLRGDCETFHHSTYKLTEPRLDEMEHRLGARKHTKEFIVEDSIDGSVKDIAYDGFTIDGEYPKRCLMGIEQKDLGYVGIVKLYSEFPAPIREVNTKLAPILAQYQYRNFISPELIIGKKGEPYVIDPCARCGSPPSELYQQMADNWAEVIWAGAHGELIEPKWNAKWGVQAMIHSPWADQNDLSLYFPDKIAEWVKLRNVAKVEDHWMVMPQNVGLPEVGAVVATGNTLMEAMKKLVEYSRQVEGYQTEVQLKALPDVIESIDQAQRHGIKFDTAPLPTVSQVANLIG
jgi:hypothetical protein